MKPVALNERPRTMNAITLHHRFIEPLDVLFLRGNKLFGDAGSYGESLVPPWPSVAAGALRSAMLAHDQVDLQAFAQSRANHPTLGTPAAPGAFAIHAFTLARQLPDGCVESLHPLPADLVAEVSPRGETPIRLTRMNAAAPPVGVGSSAPLPLWPVLPQADRAKPAGGCWLTQGGWQAYLAGRMPSPAQVLTTRELWSMDERIGLGLDAERRRAVDGQLFTVQAVALRAGVGFLASVAGAEPPSDGVLRLGGDGRGAAVRLARHDPALWDAKGIAQARCARIVLTTPGLFPQDWRLPGLDADGHLHWPGLRARLACAAVPRADVVSGWDLALRAPKPAERVAPAGSVYWLDELEATPEALCKLAEQGLWLDASHHAQRRAEGFNRFTFAAW